jgi:hypothetical protein
VLVGLVGLLLVGCGRPGWREFVSDEGGFRIQMPGPPSEEEETLAGPFSARIHKFVFDAGDAVFMVSYVDHPKVGKNPRWGDDLNTCRYLLDMHVKGPTNGPVPIRTTANRPVRQGKHSGREMQVEAAQLGRADRTRTFVVDRRLFTVRVAGALKVVTSRDARRFLDSFRIEHAPNG